MFRNFDTWSCNPAWFKVKESLIDAKNQTVGSLVGKRRRIIPYRSKATLTTCCDSITIRSEWKSVFIIGRDNDLNVDVIFPAAFPLNNAGRYAISVGTTKFEFWTPKESRRPILCLDDLLHGDFRINNNEKGHYVFYERVSRGWRSRNPIFTGAAADIIDDRYVNLLVCFVFWIGVLHHS